MLNNLDYIFIAVYVGLLLLVGLKAGKGETQEEFLIGGRKLKTFEAATTIVASKIGAGFLLTVSAFVYLYGIAAVWYFFGAVFGYFVFYFFAKKLKVSADAKRYYTLPDFFFDKYGKISGYIVGGLTFILMFSWVVVSFIGAGKVLSSFVNVNFEVATLIAALLILVYLVAGGFKAVVKTDVIQFFGIMILGVLMIVLFIQNPVSVPKESFDLFAMSTFDVVSFFLVGMFFPLASAELWQRVYAVDSQKTLKKSLIMASVLYVLIGLLVVFTSLLIRESIANLDPDSSLVIGLSSMLPMGFGGIALVVFYSAIMSSTDTYLFTSNASLIQDLLFRGNDKSIAKYSRYSMFSLMLLAVILAIVFQDIIDVTIVFLSISMSLGLLVFVLWMLPKLNRISVSLSVILSGLGTVIYMIVFGIDTMMLAASMGLSILGIIFGVIISRIRLAIGLE